MKKYISRLSFVLILLTSFLGRALAFDDIKTLPIGDKAPDFSLPGIDGKTYTLQSFKDAKVLVIVFMCNHCPTSQAYENRVIKITSDYASKGIKVVAINPIYPAGLRLDGRGGGGGGGAGGGGGGRAGGAGGGGPGLY